MGFPSCTCSCTVACYRLGSLIRYVFVARSGRSSLRIHSTMRAEDDLLSLPQGSLESTRELRLLLPCSEDHLPQQEFTNHRDWMRSLPVPTTVWASFLTHLHVWFPHFSFLRIYFSHLCMFHKMINVARNDQLQTNRQHTPC